jgi:ATPase subunit of ABC transporter with duplicated ATPase domains
MRNGTPLLDISLEGEEAGARGWEGLAEWTGGLPPEQVEAAARTRSAWEEAHAGQISAADRLASLKERLRQVEALPSGDLDALAADDRVLDKAAIDVRFGLDGKEPLPLGDPSFSGGQQVIAGLILLMAMAETDGRGFFLLDEPFAHLSLDRVAQVGRFLRASRSQLVLTAPTTLDRAQLDPAAMVIVLQKKRPGEPHAPVPIVAEA